MCGEVGDVEVEDGQRVDDEAELFVREQRVEQHKQSGRPAEQREVHVGVGQAMHCRRSGVYTKHDAPDDGESEERSAEHHESRQHRVEVPQQRLRLLFEKYFTLNGLVKTTKRWNESTRRFEAYAPLVALVEHCVEVEHTQLRPQQRAPEVAVDGHRAGCYASAQRLCQSSPLRTQ